MKNEDKHTRIIWIIDNYYKEEGKEPQYKVDEDIGTVWQEKLEILKEGTFPPKCFVNKSREPTPVAKFKIDVFDPENLKQLEKIGEKLTTAILLSPPNIPSRKTNTASRNPGPMKYLAVRCC